LVVSDRRKLISEAYLAKLKSARQNTDNHMLGRGKVKPELEGLSTRSRLICPVCSCF